MPIAPARTEASSVRMSPNMFSVTTTSSAAGPVIRRMAAISTRTCSSAMSGFAAPTSTVTCRQSRDDSSTFALSTEVSLRWRPRAREKASSITRRTS